MDPFELGEELLRLQDEGLSEYFVAGGPADVADWSRDEIKTEMDGALERIAEDAAAICDRSTYGLLSTLVRSLGSFDSATALDVMTSIAGVLSAVTTSVREAQEVDPTGTFDEERERLERAAFLVYWAFSLMEQTHGGKGADGGIVAAVKRAAAKKAAGKSKKSADADAVIDWTQTKQVVLAAQLAALELPMGGKLWQMSHERDAFIGLFTKPAWALLESAETVKQAALRDLLLRLLAVAVKSYEQNFATVTSIVQNLTYFAHAPEPMAALVVELAGPREYPETAADTLAEIAKLQFAAQQENAKHFAAFISAVAERQPRVVDRKLAQLIKHIDSENYALRMAIIDSIGAIVAYKQGAGAAEAAAGSDPKQVETLLDVLLERFRDNNAFVRSRVLQITARLCEGGHLPLQQRSDFVALSAGRLKDKSSHVRKNAMQAVGALLRTHPFLKDGGKVDVADLQARLNEAESKLAAFLESADLPTDVRVMSPRKPKAGRRMVRDEDEDEDEEQLEEENDENDEGAENRVPEADTKPTPPVPAELAMLKVTQRYYTDALHFAQQIDAAIAVAERLLLSTTKTDVTEAIALLIIAFDYGVPSAAAGVRKMVHLVWSRDDGAAVGKSIKDHVVDAYQLLYFSADPRMSARDRASHIARNLFALLSNMSIAELTSFEELVSLLMARGLVPSELVDVLWTFYGSQSTKVEVPVEYRRGAVVLLGMLARSDRGVVADKIDTLVRVGLGAAGHADPLLAKFTCTALLRLDTRHKPKKPGKEAGPPPRAPMPPTHVLADRLCELILGDAPIAAWFGLAETALECVYALFDQPSAVSARLLTAATERAFRTSPAPDALHRLLFLVGHVAAKENAHLEAIERHWKRTHGGAAKGAKEKESAEAEAAGKVTGSRKRGGAKAAAEQAAVDDLEACVGGGTNEDEFVDTLAAVREHELLFSSKSMLAAYAPMVVHVCANNAIFEDELLQTVAATALAKLMCLSSRFCEDNLQLLLTILEKSPLEVVRNNLVAALGDMVVLFSSLIDENIGFLYNRLADPSLMVRKSTLMVLTHLILNGMIKVKGQIAEMARCIIDPDEAISDMAKLFFTELSMKDNALYNNLADIISGLSVGAAPLSAESFQQIMRFLLQFISKEKHTESLVDKLSHRFRQCETTQQCRDLAYCISLLSFTNDKPIKRLLDNFALYKDKLTDEHVTASLLDAIAKARKTQKGEGKSSLDELETRIREAAGLPPITASAATGKAATAAAADDEQPADEMEL